MIPASAQDAGNADLSKLIADAAKWESGQNVEPLQKIERLLIRMMK